MAAPTRASTCTCRGCAASLARPRRSPGTCIRCGGGGGGGGGRAGGARRAGARLMRRRLALLVTMVTAMVLVAFVVPLAIVVRLIIADRAITDANEVVRSVSGQVATGANRASVQQ